MVLKDTIRHGEDAQHQPRHSGFLHESQCQWNFSVLGCSAGLKTLVCLQAPGCGRTESTKKTQEALGQVLHDMDTHCSAEPISNNHADMKNIFSMLSYGQLS